MLLIDKGATGTGGAGRAGRTWVVHDGKRVAKFQYVGAVGDRGYFTIVPVEKSGSRQRTEYLTDRPTAVVPACTTGTATKARKLSPGTAWARNLSPSPPVRAAAKSADLTRSVGTRAFA